METSDAPIGLDDLARDRAAVLRRTRTPWWYFIVLAVMVSALALAVGLGIGTWWAIPVQLAVILGSSVLVGLVSRSTGAAVPNSAWPAWIWIPAIIIATVPVLGAAALHFGGASPSVIAALGIVCGPVAAAVSALLTRRWESTRTAP